MANTASAKYTRNFHGTKVQVELRPQFDLRKIRSWTENLRTMLNLNIIAAKFGIEPERVTDEYLLAELRKDKILKLGALAKDIKIYGVTTPIIIYQNNLLDGNRRFFAAMLARLGLENEGEPPDAKKSPEEFEQWRNATFVPANIITEKLSSDQIQKINSSLNFLSDHKIPWPREVRFQHIKVFFENHGAGQDAYDQIYDLYGFTKSDVDQVLRVIKFTEEFKDWREKNRKRLLKIDSAGPVKGTDAEKNYNERTNILIRDDFIKFEEFFNFFNQCDFLENGYKMDNYIFSIAPKLWIGKKENQNLLLLK